MCALCCVAKASAGYGHLQHSLVQCVRSIPIRALRATMIAMSTSWAAATTRLSTRGVQPQVSPTWVSTAERVLTRGVSSINASTARLCIRSTGDEHILKLTTSFLHNLIGARRFSSTCRHAQDTIALLSHASCNRHNLAQRTIHTPPRIQRKARQAVSRSRASRSWPNRRSARTASPPCPT